MSCGVGRRRGSDPVLLWLWCRLADVALIGPLAWEPPYAMGGALKKQTKKSKNTPQKAVTKKKSYVTQSFCLYCQRTLYYILPCIVELQNFVTIPFSVVYIYLNPIS